MFLMLPVCIAMPTISRVGSVDITKHASFWSISLSKIVESFDMKNVLRWTETNE